MQVQPPALTPLMAQADINLGSITRASLCKGEWLVNNAPDVVGTEGLFIFRHAHPLLPSLLFLTQTVQGNSPSPFTLGFSKVAPMVFYLGRDTL